MVACPTIFFGKPSIEDTNMDPLSIEGYFLPVTVWCILQNSEGAWLLGGICMVKRLICRLLLITMAVGNFSNTDATLITKASLRPKWGRKARRCCSSWHHRSLLRAWCTYVEIVHIYISLQLLVLVVSVLCFSILQFCCCNLLLTPSFSDAHDFSCSSTIL
jgi:hypothetical protein